MKLLPRFKDCICLKTDYSLVFHECLVKLINGLINGQMTGSLFGVCVFTSTCINENSLFQSPNWYTLIGGESALYAVKHVTGLECTEDKP